MRSLLLSLLLLMPLSAGATLAGDTVAGCLSDAGCTEGDPGNFLSPTATVDEVLLEFEGTAGGFGVTADFLTFAGEQVIRVDFSGAAGTSLPAGWELSFFSLDGVGGNVEVIGASIDMTFQNQEIDASLDSSVLCSPGDQFCIDAVNALNADAKATASPDVQSLTFGPNGLSLVLNDVPSSSSGFVDHGPWFDIVIETQVVPEPSTALLVAGGLLALAARRRL